MKMVVSSNAVLLVSYNNIIKKLEEMKSKEQGQTNTVNLLG